MQSHDVFLLCFQRATTASGRKIKVLMIFHDIKLIGMSLQSFNESRLRANRL